MGLPCSGSPRSIAAEVQVSLKERIRGEGRALGFNRIGFAAAGERPESRLLREWLGRGYAGGMAWMRRRLRERADPSVLAPWARSLVVATLPYDAAPGRRRPGSGLISRYARGPDYHLVLKGQLGALGRVLEECSPGARVRPVVDTGAILEKPWASAAGLGWQGKHTNLIDPSAGSWLFIGEILTDIELDPDDALITDQCGECTRCLDACPTGALPEPYVLDSRRCISYLTIEHRETIPVELRPRMGAWIFGCDVCQEVCPWNRFPSTGDAPLAGATEVSELADYLRLSPAEFRRRFARSAVLRAGWRGFLRNVSVAMGNSGDSRAVGPLIDALENSDPLVREHVAWAIGRLATDTGREALRSRLAREEDPGVRAAISMALEDDGVAGDGPSRSPVSPDTTRPSPGIQ